MVIWLYANTGLLINLYSFLTDEHVYKKKVVRQIANNLMSKLINHLPQEGNIALHFFFQACDVGII